MEQKEYTFIRVDVTDDVTTIVFNRPEVKNAFNSKMIKEIVAAVRDSETLFVVFKGEGDVFSAGADVDYMRKVAHMGYEDNLKDAHLLSQLFDTIANSSSITISLVKGVAMGGAIGIVAASDFSIVANSASFAFSEVRLGLVPATVSPYVLAKIGKGKALELFLTGRQFDASEALSAGLITKLVSVEKLQTELDTLLETLRQNSPAAMRSVKKLIAIVDTINDDVMEVTPAFIADARASLDGQEGLSAFLEKRKPCWFNSESNGKGW